MADTLVAVPGAPLGTDVVVGDLVLEPLELLESDMAEVGGNEFDPIRNSREVVEGGEGTVGVVVEAVWSPDSDLGWVGEGLVGGMVLGGGASGRWEAGDFEDRILDVPGLDRIGAGEAARVEGSGMFARRGFVFAVALASVALSPARGAVERRLVFAGLPGLVVGEVHFGMGAPAAVVGGGHAGVDVVPDPVDRELHVGVDVPRVEGLGLWAGWGLDHVWTEERGEVLGVEWAWDEVHIEATGRVRAGLLGRVWDGVSGCCSSSLYTF